MQIFKNVSCFLKSAPVLLSLGVAAILGGCGGDHSSTEEGLRAPSMIFSTYLGGSTPCDSCASTHTFAQNAASDTAGNTYVTGASAVADLPVKNAYQGAPAAGSTLSAFVAKYDPTGKLLWCTYLGGDNQSIGTGIAAMPDGGVAVVGYTSSDFRVTANVTGKFNGGVAVGGYTRSDSTASFPTLNAYQPSNNGLTDYFVTVFDASGNMQYSTYLGGSGVEGDPNFSDDNSNGNNIAVDAQGLIYITGVTTSTGAGSEAIQFPVTSQALQKAIKGDSDAFLAIIDPGQSGSASLLYASFHGGSKNEKGHSVAVNAAGNLIAVGGYTDSADFPTTATAYRSAHPPSGWTSNGFITQFSSSRPGDPSSPLAMRYSTYLGGNTAAARDDTYGITLDANGLIVATGRTESADFPMLDASHPSIYNRAPNPTAPQRNDQPYVVKIDPALSGAASLVYATFLGGGSTSGGGGAFGTSVAVDANGSVHVSGETDSRGVLYISASVPDTAPEWFPYTKDALLQSLQGSFDAILMQVSPDGATLAYSTFLGGPESDRAYGLAVDPAGNVVISGLTFSSNFPVQNPAQPWPGNAGNQNAFVTKFGR